MQYGTQKNEDNIWKNLRKDLREIFLEHEPVKSQDSGKIASGLTGSYTRH